MRARVRLGDAGPHGRIRLDGIARLLQDIAGEEGDDAGLGGVYVLRRIELCFEGAWPRLGDEVRLLTFCSGSGGRWAERRTILEGPSGAVASAAIWVLVDPVTGRPLRLSPRFGEVYGELAVTRQVSGRLTISGPPEDLAGRPWAIRAADFDVLGHVNNARYWEAVEDELSLRDRPRVERAVLEFRAAIEVGDQPELVASAADGCLRIWLRGPAGVHAAAELTLSADR